MNENFVNASSFSLCLSILTYSGWLAFSVPCRLSPNLEGKKAKKKPNSSELCDFVSVVATFLRPLHTCRFHF
jgi:hypothetical protein